MVSQVVCHQWLEAVQAVHYNSKAILELEKANQQPLPVPAI
jgi:hypothetical protein